MLFQNVIIGKKSLKRWKMTDPAKEHFLDKSNDKSISTLEEWTNMCTASDSNYKTIILQLGSEWCRNCPPVHGRILELKSKYNFQFVYSDTQDSELVEHYEISRLPTVIVYNPKLEENKTIVLQAAIPDQVQSTIQTNSIPILHLDEDF